MGLRYCLAIYESKIFQCKVENLKKSKNAGFPKRPRGAPVRIFRFLKIFNFALKDFLAASRKHGHKPFLFVDDDILIFKDGILASKVKVVQL